MSDKHCEKEKILSSWLADVMERVGWMGKFTIRTFILMFIIVIYGAMNIVATVFLSADVPHHCQSNELLMDHVLERCQVNRSDIPLELTIPFEDGKPSKCEMYNPEALFNISCSNWNYSSTANLSTVSCSEWWYNRTIFTSTVIMDFNLVCNNLWKQELSQFLLMFGILVGATMCGICSDKWGRRPCFIASGVILSVSSILTSVLQIFWLHMLVRLFVGVGSIGLCISGVVYALEVVNVKQRVIVNQILQATFSFGFMFIALFAYLERRWVYLNLYLSLPLLVLLPLYICFSAESPRWLLSKNKTKKAIAVLKRTASVNGKNFDRIMDDLKQEKDLLLKSSPTDYPNKEVVVSPPQKLSTSYLFRNPSLRLITLVLMYNWFTVTCIYYGLTLNTSSLSGDVFLNFFLGGVVEIPANFGVLPIIHYWGRRPVICVCNFICGISLVCMMFIAEDMNVLNIVLFLIGKFGVTTTFACIYLYSSELYPTPLRGNGLGVCSGFSRLGGLVSLLVVMLRHINPKLPFAVFGVIAALAGCLIVLLPETRGIPLPEKIEDTERLHKNREVSLLKQFVPGAVRHLFS